MSAHCDISFAFFYSQFIFPRWGGPQPLSQAEPLPSFIIVVCRGPARAPRKQSAVARCFAPSVGFGFGSGPCHLFVSGSAPVVCRCVLWWSVRCRAGPGFRISTQALLFSL